MEGETRSIRHIDCCIFESSILRYIESSILGYIKCSDSSIVGYMQTFDDVAGWRAKRFRYNSRLLDIFKVRYLDISDVRKFDTLVHRNVRYDPHLYTQQTFCTCSVFELASGSAKSCAPRTVLLDAVAQFDENRRAAKVQQPSSFCLALLRLFFVGLPPLFIPCQQRFFVIFFKPLV